MEIAQRQGSRSFILRAVLSFANPYQTNARPADAHAILAPALEGFLPAPEMPEIAEAQALLAALAETDAVKADAARRERRVKLQNAYGQALIRSKGYAAEEAKAAFARADDLIQSENSAERYAVYNAQWARSFVRGELNSARTIAERFLSEADAEGCRMEAVRARTSVVATCLHQGELGLARSCLQRALADRAPEWEADARRVFGADVGILATDYLAVSTWLLGEAESARGLIEQAVREAQRSGHVATIITTYEPWAVLDGCREDPAATLRAAEALLGIAREHNVAWHEAHGKFFSAGRAVVSSARRKARGSFVSRCQAFTNKAIGCSRRGSMVSLPSSRPVRGASKTPLPRWTPGRRSPGRPGSAGRTRFSFAGKARSCSKPIPPIPRPPNKPFEPPSQLGSSNARAASACARRGRSQNSTNRPAAPPRAHAVLAPALEGFSPTPARPGIAEAQALMAALAESDEVKAADAKRAPSKLIDLDL